MNNEHIEPKSELTQLDLLVQINNNLEKLIEGNRNIQHTMVNIAYMVNGDFDNQIAGKLNTTIRIGNQTGFIRSLNKCPGVCSC